MFDDSIPPVAWRDPAGVKKLKVAFYTDNGILTPAPVLRRAVREAAVALREGGAEVEEWLPPDLSEAWEIQLRLTCADGLASHRRALRKSRGGKVRLAAMPAMVRSALGLLCQVAGQKRLATSIRSKHRLSMEEYFQIVEQRRQYCTRFLATLDARGCDAILCPPDALPALLHGSSFYVSGCSISYPGLYSLLGMPVGVVAATRVRAGEESDRPPGGDLVERAARRIETGSAGLPVGVQVAARPWREDVVLAVMAQLEDHFRRQPDFPAWPPVLTPKQTGSNSVP
jgi:fatty acid amide hydrolase